MSKSSNFSLTSLISNCQIWLCSSPR
uniref:Uncharacterized protein n=1 Tax=Anguilla anguilla TaxID=7936 RepID=A0A0E9UXT8_ANGAN